MDPTEEARRHELAKEARRIEEDTQHSGAQHFAAGQRWRDRAFWLGLPTTILVAGRRWTCNTRYGGIENALVRVVGKHRIALSRVQRLEESSSWPRPTAVLTQRSGPHEMSARAANGGVRRAGSARRRR